MAEGDTGFGQAYPTDTSGPFNPDRFLIGQVLARVSTAKIVKITAVDTSAKTVDVQPMVKMVDGTGNTAPHGTVFGIPYWILQFGKNAVLADPVAGDIGLMICCDRDISAVKSTKDIAPPGSARQLDIADGIYFGGVLNDDPDQWVKFTDTGMELHDKNGNALVSSSSGWEFTGPVKFKDAVTAEANIETTADVVAGAISLKNHVHSYLRPTSGATTPTNTGAPT